MNEIQDPGGNFGILHPLKLNMQPRTLVTAAEIRCSERTASQRSQREDYGAIATLHISLCACQVGFAFGFLQIVDVRDLTILCLASPGTPTFVRYGSCDSSIQRCPIRAGLTSTNDGSDHEEKGNSVGCIRQRKSESKSESCRTCRHPFGGTGSEQARSQLAPQSSRLRCSLHRLEM